MASSELDWTVSQSYELDSTDATISDDEEKDSTDGTISDEEEGADQKVRMDADSTEATHDKFSIALDADSTDVTQDKFGASIEAGQAASKIPSSEIIIRTISVERTAPLAALPANADAAFSQWLSGSGLAPAKH